MKAFRIAPHRVDRSSEDPMPFGLMGPLESAKRTRHERSGVHAWHPYYAGFSERFVESAVSALELSTSHTVLDPWVGSGTTTHVCSRLGLRSVGVDINPPMVFFAAAKSYSNLHVDWKDELSTVKARVQPEKLNEEGDDPLSALLSPKFARTIHNFVRALPDWRLSSKLAELSELGLVGESTVIDRKSAFLLAATFVTVRRLAGYKRASNPTWLGAMDADASTTMRSLLSEVHKTTKWMQETLKAEKFESDNLKEATHTLGDSRKLPVAPDFFDAVITSPPYLTRIDYAVSTKLELLTVFDEAEAQRIRQLSMGSTVILKDVPKRSQAWGVKCNALLEGVEGHSSKAAKSYYLKSFLQYFRDAEHSLREIHRTLKPGGTALIVVQSSYFKEILVPLGDIYVEMGSCMGFESGIAAREEIRGHMAHVNTRSTKYMKNKIYFEDVVLLRKTKG
jgi:DNA modification methylase